MLVAFSFCLLDQSSSVRARAVQAITGTARRRAEMVEPPPLPPTNRTSLVPPLVLSGHAASLTPSDYSEEALSHC